MEPADFDVAACLGRVRAGDESAARELVDQHYPLVIRVVRGHRPRAILEEDLAQEIFVKMFTKLEHYRGDTPFSHWLSRVALTTCLDHLRVQYRRGEWRMADLGEDEARAIEECFADGSTREGAIDALAAKELAGKLLEQLPPKDRVVVTLIDMEGRSVAETAEATGMSQTLVKVRAFRARRKLRSVMEKWRKEKKI